MLNEWATPENQWAPQSVRTLAAAREVVDAAGERPSVLIVNYGNTDDETGSNTTYGWAKTYTNVFRTGLSGEAAKYHVTYVGTVEDFRNAIPADGPSENYRDTSRSHWRELNARLEAYPEAPVVFLIGEYYQGLCNGLSAAVHARGAGGGDRVRDRTRSRRTRDVRAHRGRALRAVPEVVDGARAAADAAAARFADPPGPLDDLPHQARARRAVPPRGPAGAARRAVLRPDRHAEPAGADPRTSIVLSLLAGIAVLGIWRGPLTDTKAWVVVGVAVGTGAVLRFAAGPISGRCARSAASSTASSPSSRTWTSPS